MARTYLGNTEIKKLYVGSNNISKAISPVNYEPIVSSDLLYDWDGWQNATDSTWTDQISGSELNRVGEPVYTPPANYLSQGNYYFNGDAKGFDEYLYGSGIYGLTIGYTFTFTRTYQWWMKIDAKTQHASIISLCNGEPGNASRNWDLTIFPSDTQGITLGCSTVNSRLNDAIIPMDNILQGQWALYTITHNHPTTGINTQHYFKGYVNKTKVSEFNEEFDHQLVTDPQYLYVANRTEPGGASPDVNLNQTAIAQILMYNKVLSDAEVVQNYNANAYRFNAR